MNDERRDGRRRVVWLITFVVANFGTLISAGTLTGTCGGPASTSAVNDFWAVLMGAVAFLSLVFAAGFVASHFFKN